MHRCRPYRSLWIQVVAMISVGLTSDSREDVMIMPCEDDWVLVCAPTYGYCMQAADIDAFTRITNLIEDGKYYITVRSRRLFVCERGPGEFCYPGTINPVDLYACLFGVSGVAKPRGIRHTVASS